MARLDGDAFLEPLSSDLPCGPDLERDMDLEFTAFVVDAEGVLPRSFFAFKRDTAMVREKLDAIVALTGRTRDLRLLALYAKFAILDRDLAEFANALSVMARALETHWEHIHPQAEEGDLGLRSAAISSLDDMPQVVMPLQHVVLFRHRALGDVTFRSIQLARGIIPRRDKETVPELSVVERALEMTDPEWLSAVRGLFEAVLAAVARIEAACDDKPGMPSVQMPRISRLATDVCETLAPYMRMQAPVPEMVADAADGEVDDADGEGTKRRAEAISGAAPDLLTSRAGAAAALAGIEGYFRRHEPASPGLVLVTFARRLMGKPFHEVLQLLIPDQASDAELMIGGNAIRISLSRMAAELEGAEQGGEEAAELDDVPVLDTRRDAVRLMGDLARYLRIAEPASPVPLLLDRAADLASRDFSSLLKDMFTDAALRAMKGDDS